MSGSGTQAEREACDRRSAPERITLAVSALLVLGLLGGLAWLQLSQGSSPAGIRVEPDYDAAFRRDGAWYLPVEVTNSGDRSTDDVRVELSRPVEGEEPEVAELEFTFLAGGETNSGWAVFDERPTADAIEVDELSYTDP